jgi:hypothetical protein
MNKITPFLWFNDNAEDAAEFYLSVFPEAKKVAELRSSGVGPWPAGKIATITIELVGQQMTFGEDWRDPEASQSDGCDDEDGEVRHRYAGGRGEGVTARSRSQTGKGSFPLATSCAIGKRASQSAQARVS